MPWLFNKCNHPGCYQKVKKFGESYCPLHLKERRQQYDRMQRDPAIIRFYHSAAWQKVRLMKLNQDPLCEQCLKEENRTVVATIADHIKDIRRGGERLDMNNLQSLCAECHGRKHPFGRGEENSEGSKT